ncbi:MAG: pyridoxamine 5'-phosphate oxidase family protein [Planctomycetes bacterium]|nr:pyridoxamine 5'-phosphate oxidase family protein [Planctomycetota bacterium]
MQLISYDSIADQAWKLLAQAGDDRSHPMRVVVLATLGDDGSPEARLMVVRGADRSRGKLWFYTDLRSPKVQQLRACPAVSAIAWDPACGVQLRIRGTATIDSSSPLADDHWLQASLGLQVLLHSPEDPGRPLKQPDPRLMGMKTAMDANDEAAARRNFAVIEITITGIEWLQVCDDDQRRAIMNPVTDWQPLALAP